MRQWILCLLAGTISLTMPAVVVVAGDLSVSKTVNLKGSPEATWSLIGDYCAIQDWHPAIAKCEIVSGTNNRAGAMRVLTLGDGATIREELIKHDARARTYSYKILESPLPVVSYTATITVFAGSNGGSVVEWKSTFKAGPNTDDATARTTIEGIYDAGLANLQAKDAKK
jgi:mxaD protein